jgi:hypothetical protein
VATHAKISRAEQVIREAEKVLREKESFARASGVGCDNASLRKFHHTALTIRAKQGGVVKFHPNPNQMRADDYWWGRREQEKAVRMIILKPRQEGFSTWTQSLNFTLVDRLPHRKATTIAHRNSTATAIHQMAKRFYYYLPEVERKPLEGGKPTKHGIKYELPHDSEIVVATAGSDDIGFGETSHYNHWTEFSRWPNAEELYDGLMQCVPNISVTGDSSVIIESTANGQQNLFYQLWLDAQDPESDWFPLFIRWQDNPANALALHDGEKLRLDHKESDYMEEFGLSMEQMKWAKFIRRNQCREVWEKFHQDYPASAELAFRYSGFPWLSVQVLTQLTNDAVPHVWQGDIEPDGTVPALSENPYGPLRIWKMPEEGVEYAIGMDVGEGVNADFTEIIVLTKEGREMVARWRANDRRGRRAGVAAFCLGQFYNWALLGIERNGCGLEPLLVCEEGHADFPITASGYPNLYYEVRRDRKNPAPTKRMGWHTSRDSKDNILDRAAEDLTDGVARVPDMLLITQFKGMVRDPETDTWKMTYSDPISGLRNDDGVMSYCIANAMVDHLRRKKLSGYNMPVKTVSY